MQWFKAEGFLIPSFKRSLIFREHSTPGSKNFSFMGSLFYTPKYRSVKASKYLQMLIRRFNEIRTPRFDHMLITAWNIRKYLCLTGKCVCGHYFLPCLLNKCWWYLWEQCNSRLDGSLGKSIFWSVGKQADVCGESVKCNSVMCFT